jgi:hypothetical protein
MSLKEEQMLNNHNNEVEKLLQLYNEYVNRIAKDKTAVNHRFQFRA